MVWEGKEKTRRSSEEEDVSIWPLGSPPHILITTPSSSQRHTPFLPDFPCVGPLTSVVSFSLHCPCLRNDATHLCIFEQVPASLDYVLPFVQMVKLFRLFEAQHELVFLSMVHLIAIKSMYSLRLQRGMLLLPLAPPPRLLSLMSSLYFLPSPASRPPCLPRLPALRLTVF